MGEAPFVAVAMLEGHGPRRIRLAPRNVESVLVAVEDAPTGATPVEAEEAADAALPNLPLERSASSA
jgi:hypothetical protein